jgi:hypothetical protein
MAMNAVWNDSRSDMSITIKTDNRYKKVVTRSAVLLSVLLLSACANFPRAKGAPGVVQESRQSDAAPQPSVSQKATPAETQQPVSAGQGNNLPQKPKHNVEED